MANRWGNNGNSETLLLGAPESLQMVTTAMKLKEACSFKNSYDQPRQHIKKHRHYFSNKIMSSQSYVFFSSHVWMWELDYKESCMLKNWCFWTVVLEKILESSLDCKQIQPIHPKGNQSLIFIGGTDREAEAPILWLLDGKNLVIGKDPDAGKYWRQKDKWMTEAEMIQWHHRLSGHEFDHALGVSEEQGNLVFCSPLDHKDSDRTERLNNLKTKTLPCHKN